MLYFRQVEAKQKLQFGASLMIEKLSYRWAMLGLGWLAYFSFGMINTSLAPLTLIIRSDLNLTYTQFGTILGAWPLTYIAVSYVEGIMIDRFGIRKSVAVGVLLLALSVFLRSFAVDFATLFAAVAVFGLGGPMISIGLPKLIALWFSGRERGTAAGIYMTGSTLGNSFSLALTNSVIFPLTGSWQNTFRMYAVGALAIAVIWYILGRDIPQFGDDNKGVKNQSTGGNFAKVMHFRDVWVVVIIGFAAFVILHGLRNWLPLIFELNGMTAADAGFLASLPSLIGVVGSIALNRMAVRLNSKKPLILTLLAVTGVGIYIMGTSTGLVLWVSLIVYGFCSGALTPLMMLVLMDNRDVGKELMGAAGGLYFTIGEIGGFSGPFIMGYVKDYTGSFLFGIILLAVFVEVMLIPAFILRERKSTSAQRAN